MKLPRYLKKLKKVRIYLDINLGEGDGTDFIGSRAESGSASFAIAPAKQNRHFWPRLSGQKDCFFTQRILGCVSFRKQPFWLTQIITQNLPILFCGGYRLAGDVILAAKNYGMPPRRSY